ncbi:arrestin domain conatining protein [Dothidotthia symphoricarpi CBS 119687]|uniref:Arrestin domain conatining protein n=1 Tax=Dothidotthia symphoricarpi CBS 119687 TaxID=1392245 RepID=A0A6A6AKC8_9PLEO|nr:arrestin domain conatining protein [Dothidotthia symphoricarpi CBS 119687]KAF2131568.1 arrestin domain conatining protein [Dothidotthia symphoricarpi CBS 119687]
MSAFVRVSGPPNSNFLVGYPGISATLPRIEGKVEIRPLAGISAPVNISLVTIALHRRETIHPSAESVTKKHLGAPRKEITDIVGKEMLLFRCHNGREFESILSMDLPFVIFIPYGRGGEEVARRVPPASLQLPSRTAETFYELVVTVQQGQQEQKKYPFPVPIQRYDTLSTFGMYNRPESAERVTDHLVTLGISLPRWSYGPMDPVSVYIKLSPNRDWLNKAKKVTIQKITVGIDEEIIYNHEGDEPSRKVKTLARTTQAVGVKMPEAGYFTNLGLVFPAKDLRDSEGVIPRGKKEFPMYAVNGFTTTGTLYKIEYYLTVKAQMSSARDILLRQPIVVCPFDHAGCKEEMEAIEQAAKDAAHVAPENPMLPASTIVRASDPMGLSSLGIAIVGGVRKPLIE